ncbi:MAG: TIM barrel protein [Bacteroidota bacterium]
MNISRRAFLQASTALGIALIPGIHSSGISMHIAEDKKNRIALSQWAFHRAIFGDLKENDYHEWLRLLKTDPDQTWQGELHPLDFPVKARELGFGAVEYVNTLMYGHARDTVFLKELKGRTQSEGIENMLIMVDEEGMLGDPDAAKQKEAVTRHANWLYAAKELDCFAIRVNAHSVGDWEEQKKRCVDGLHQLLENAREMDLSILIENHGGLSSNPDWLLQTIQLVDDPRLGTMVDFDNFQWSQTRIWNGEHRYDRYEGVSKLMPLAKAVSAKSYAFDDSGYETTIDFKRMMGIVAESGYDGHISAEFEGNQLSEKDGTLATKSLIERYLSS